MKQKTFTPKQLASLPKEGYWLEFYQSGGRPTAVCVKNGYVKYIHNSWGKEWCTLMWTCCFTQKDIEKAAVDLNSFSSYKHYNTIEELRNDNPTLPEFYFDKAPNDFVN